MDFKALIVYVKLSLVALLAGSEFFLASLKAFESHLDDWGDFCCMVEGGWILRSPGDLPTAVLYVTEAAVGDSCRRAHLPLSWTRRLCGWGPPLLLWSLRLRPSYRDDWDEHDRLNHL